MAAQNRMSMSSLPGAVLRVGSDGRVLELNEAAEQLECQCQREMSFTDCLNEDGKPELRWRLAATGPLPAGACELEVGIRGRLYRLTFARTACADGSRFIQMADITAYRNLSESRRLLEACMAQIQDVIIITETDPLDPPGPKILYVNEGVERMTGYRPDEVLGRTPRIFQGPDTDKDALRRIRKALARREPVKEVLINYCKDGVPFWNELEIVPIPASAFGGKSYFASIQRDITETKLREAKLRHSQDELRQLSRAQEGILEQERRRIARDLHDELGQTLTALKLNLGVAVKQMEELSGNHRQRLEAITASVDDAVEKVREISSNLRPPMLDDLGFEAAAEWLLARWAEQGAVEVRWYSAPAGDGVVRGEEATALYRILQECMTNVSRHSGASRVIIRYHETAAAAILEVHDNGCGFDPALAGHYGSGLVGIRERVTMLGGELKVESAAGKGVRVLVQLPLEDKLDD